MLIISVVPRMVNRPCNNINKTLNVQPTISPPTLHHLVLLVEDKLALKQDQASLKPPGVLVS